MAKKPALTLDELIAEIEDTLPELAVSEPTFGWIKSARHMLISGYYVQYRIGGNGYPRAVYLGSGVKVEEMKRKFIAWSVNWRV